MEKLQSQGEMLSQLELKSLPHSAFDLSNHNFGSGKLGKIIPVRYEEAYPGDHFKGFIESVDNFEPLVGPIMGSMVTKMESFYIPYDIIWRNSHKFFTGKNGFDKSMPSISPQDVYSCYRSLRYSSQAAPFNLILSMQAISSYLVSMWQYLESELTIPSLRDVVNDLRSAIQRNHDSLIAFGDRYLVRDLVQPVIDYSYNHVLRTEIVPGVLEPESDFDKATLSLFAAVLAQDGVSAAFEAFCRVVTDLLKYQYKYFFGVSTLLDYLGWPVMDDWDGYFVTLQNYVSSRNGALPEPPMDEDLFSEIPLNFMLFRAAYVCWYWNYRDQLLEADAYDPESDEFTGDNVSAVQAVLCTLLRVRCWYKDTFTTALTNTGDGNFRVPIMQSDAMTVQFIDDSGTLLENTTDAETAIAAGATFAVIQMNGIEYSIPTNMLSGAFSPSTPYALGDDVHDYSLSLDLFDRIKRLRTFEQKRLILGHEYDDVIWSSFLVRLSNVRMRIPELLSRGRDEVAINTIVNNTSIPDGQIAGDKTAVAWAKGNTGHIDKFIEEHGLFIAFKTVLPVQSYAGGMRRFYLKQNRFDFMWPEFSTMGMDAVYNCELSAPRGKYAQAGLTDAQALQVFGYQGRYYDLKSRNDECHGRLRTDLQYLVFSREWNADAPPVLNYIMVHCWPRLDMFVTDDPSVDVIKHYDIYNRLDISRALPIASEYLGY